MPADTHDLRDLLRRSLALLRWYRRPLAAALLALAVVAVLTARDGPVGTVPVLVAQRDLAAGDRLGAGDIATAHLPVDAAPSNALTSPDAAVGRTLALPIANGEPLTDLRLVDRPLLAALGPHDDQELVATGVPLADDSVATLTRAGDVVDVLASGEAGTGGAVVEGARVLVPVPGPDERAGSGGGTGAHVVLAVTRGEAVALARAASTSRLSVALRRGAAAGTAQDGG